MTIIISQDRSILKAQLRSGIWRSCSGS